jgi:hypothetical protein
VCCVVSKPYDRDYQPYWYSYRPKWDDFLEGGIDSYFILACMDSNVAFAIPFPWMRENKQYLNMTASVDKSYWHVAVAKLDDGTLALNLPVKAMKVPLKPWAFLLTEPA